MCRNAATPACLLLLAGSRVGSAHPTHTARPALPPCRDNVLVESANCQGATKLGDFGVAQLVGADGLATAVASRRVWAYCAPEVSWQ